MRTPATAEIAIDASREEIARMLPPGRTVAGISLEFRGNWQAVGWAPSRDAWRHRARWSRGRAGGEATIEIVAAGDRRSLLSLTMSPPDGATLRRVRADDALAIARALRATVETGAVAPADDAQPVLTQHATPRIAAVPVGYSER